MSGFVAVAEELSFRGAATRLHLSQPAVSRAVSQLETELGVALLERSTHHVCLTPAGLAFLREARTVLSQVEVAARAARSAPETLTLRVAHTECTEELLPPVLRGFRRRYPSLGLDVRQVDRVSQPRWLQKRQIDVGMRRAPTTEADLDSEVVSHEPVMLAVPAGHALAEVPRVAVSELEGERFVFLPGSPTHACLVRSCEQAGFVPQVGEEASTLTSLTVLVGAGVGVAFVPASISGRFNSGDVVYRPLEAAPTLPVAVAWRRDEPGAAVEGFLAVLRALTVSRQGKVRLAAAVAGSPGEAEAEMSSAAPSN